MPASKKKRSSKKLEEMIILQADLDLLMNQAKSSSVTEAGISLQSNAAWTAAAVHFCVLMTLTDFPPFSGKVVLKTEKCCPTDGYLVAF